MRENTLHYEGQSRTREFGTSSPVGRLTALGRSLHFFGRVSSEGVERSDYDFAEHCQSQENDSGEGELLIHCDGDRLSSFIQ